MLVNSLATQSLRSQDLDFSVRFVPFYPRDLCLTGFVETAFCYSTVARTCAFSVLPSIQPLEIPFLSLTFASHRLYHVM